ncbi:MAG: hypothetical protein BGO01_17900 [Armatimonadetes bacterium 55-13]|nr:helix-turn-helix transcriptional regulator [Armatimonadota bacterium]OJU64013.1 MAG: hypothetical protein BGO01_17900 [Armatimonadetes bacterium 55-13]
MSIQAKRIQTQLFLQAPAEAALGSITLAGTIKNSPGWAGKPPRILGSFATLLILEGGGFYRDANGISQDVKTGDFLLLFPEIGHRYGPRRGGPWSEIYLVFQGPIFELLRSSGLLHPARPVVHTEDVQGYYGILRDLIEDATKSDGGQERAVCRLASVLADLCAGSPVTSRPDVGMMAVRNLLDVNLGEPVDWNLTAARVGWSYETLRKRFGAEFGISPARYRFLRKIEAAKSLLRDTGLANKEIAHVLGFADEFHFSKRFKQEVGVSPRGFRLTGTEGDRSVD